MVNYQFRELPQEIKQAIGPNPELLRIWTHFYNISQIPRNSFQEGDAREYIRYLAEKKRSRISY
jgi:hypothetical protein